MLGFSPSRYMYFCWTFISPLIIIILFIFSIVKYERVTYANSYIFPLFGELIGWCMGLASVICIPIYALFYLLRQDGSLKERIIKGNKSIIISTCFHSLIQQILCTPARFHIGSTAQKGNRNSLYRYRRHFGDGCSIKERRSGEVQRIEQV